MTMYLKPPFAHNDVSLVLYIYYHNVLDEVLPTLTRPSRLEHTNVNYLQAHKVFMQPWHDRQHDPDILCTDPTLTP